MGSRAGWYDSEAGMVGTVLASTALLFCAALLSTRWIARFERALSARRISLEAGIQQRTAELRANQEQLTAIIGTVNTAIISIDASHRIVLFNAAAERIFGVPASQMLGQPLDPLLPERFRARHAQDVQVFDQAGSTTRPMDAGARLRGLRSNGEEFPIEAAISRVEVGGRRLMTVMLRDMSDTEALDAERRARLAAEEARRTQSRFLSHLSHELRTPLNAVIGFAQLLLVDPAAAERPSLHRYARHILQAGRQQLAMVTDLLELIRVEGAPAPTAGCGGRRGPGRA
ncbi:PAS domain S-box protein [Eleftheria terrae]|uniref:PAS domain S-box protein n=1 Tax=Eleftheria terrae TaxID=1597781 RepID=UPI00263AAC4B|nr:PAS domain S-box protein [Eleftheria terrae]WKB54013.1 PAS domain-containing sensor histidine kinase [Eleftheria terrae]